MVSKVAKEKRNTGYCLNCGARITRCGIPFTLDVLCHKCGRVNVYVHSNKPLRIKEAA